MRLSNKLAVITAAASGMGRAGVRLFATEGARVCAIDVDGDSLAALAADMARDGMVIETVVADLSCMDAVRASTDEAATKLGGLDIFWAHAGIPGPAGIEDIDMDLYRKAAAINLDAAVVTAGTVAAHMRRRGGGSLIFTSSASGLVGSRFSPVYSAQKFGLVGLAKSLAQTFAPDNIRVNALCPGLTDSMMTMQFVSRKGDPEEARRNQEAFLASVPMGRLGRPEEIAHAALWLGSDDSSFVTGIELPVDGGFTCR